MPALAFVREHADDWPITPSTSKVLPFVSNVAFGSDPEVFNVKGKLIVRLEAPACNVPPLIATLLPVVVVPNESLLAMFKVAFVPIVVVPEYSLATAKFTVPELTLTPPFPEVFVPSPPMELDSVKEDEDKLNSNVPPFWIKISLPIACPFPAFPPPPVPLMALLLLSPVPRAIELTTKEPDEPTNMALPRPAPPPPPPEFVELPLPPKDKGLVPPPLEVPAPPPPP